MLIYIISISSDYVANLKVIMWLCICSFSEHMQILILYPVKEQIRCENYNSNDLVKYSDM